MTTKVYAPGYPPYAKVLLDETGNDALERVCLACNREAGWPMCGLCQRIGDAERNAANEHDA